MSRKFYLEGYGCSLNISETEKIAGFLCSNGFVQTSEPTRADLLIVNTCAVKDTTEKRMLSRFKELLLLKKPNAKLIAFGCLASARGKAIAKVSSEIVVLDNKLSSLARELGLQEKEFSPLIEGKNQLAFTSIIPISVGCVGSCSYCITKIARGNLKSFPEEEILYAFNKAILSSKQVFLTSQDLGAYGLDIGSSLPILLKKILKTKGNFFLRLGMMNPNHFMKIKKELMVAMNDDRVYKFLHLPLQSGSDSVLKKMNRHYSVKDFVDCVSYARKKIPGITIATDVIVGFPGETEKDFELTLKVLEEVKPAVVNISRFGSRPGTVAHKMPNKINEKIKKERSRRLSAFCSKLFLSENKKLVGEKFKALVCEKTKNNPKLFIARTNYYRPVIVDSCFGEFVELEIVASKANFFVGKILRVL